MSLSSEPEDGVGEGDVLSWAGVLPLDGSETTEYRATETASRPKTMIKAMIDFIVSRFNLVRRVGYELTCS